MSPKIERDNWLEIYDIAQDDYTPVIVKYESRLTKGTWYGRTDDRAENAVVFTWSAFNDRWEGMKV